MGKRTRAIAPRRPETWSSKSVVLANPTAIRIAGLEPGTLAWHGQHIVVPGCLSIAKPKPANRQTGCFAGGDHGYDDIRTPHTMLLLVRTRRGDHQITPLHLDLAARLDNFRATTKVFGQRHFNMCWCVFILGKVSPSSRSIIDSFAPQTCTPSICERVGANLRL